MRMFIRWQVAKFLCIYEMFPTRLMEDLCYGKGYKYNPDYLNGKGAHRSTSHRRFCKCPDRRELQFLTGRHLGTKRDPDLDDDNDNDTDGSGSEGRKLIWAGTLILF